MSISNVRKTKKIMLSVVAGVFTGKVCITTKLLTNSHLHKNNLRNGIFFATFLMLLHFPIRIFWLSSSLNAFKMISSWNIHMLFLIHVNSFVSVLKTFLQNNYNFFQWLFTAINTCKLPEFEWENRQKLAKERREKNVWWRSSLISILNILSDFRKFESKYLRRCAL